MPETLHYAYAIVRAGLETRTAPAGIDDEPVRAVAESGLAALTSELPAAAYAPAVLEARTASVDWLGPRARAHDGVVTWASDMGPALPLPMFSMYREEGSVRAMLRDRRPELERALERVSRGREYTVRVYLLDRDLQPRLAERSQAIRALETEAAARSPGRRYLLQRKADALRAEEAERVAEETARDVWDRLAPLALDAVRQQVPRRSEDERGGAILDASYLVSPHGLDAFRAELTSLAEAHEAFGFRFEFTGPWPAYHFAREASRAD